MSDVRKTVDLPDLQFAAAYLKAERFHLRPPRMKARLELRCKQVFRNLLGAACIKCGREHGQQLADDPSSLPRYRWLEFHHKRPKRVHTGKYRHFQTKKLRQQEWKKYKNELKQCELLCGFCHIGKKS